MRQARRVRGLTGYINYLTAELIIVDKLIIPYICCDQLIALDKSRQQRYFPTEPPTRHKQVIASWWRI